MRLLARRFRRLAHRWSFNGDWSDSVGGADAVGCGTYFSLYGNRVHMGYGACTHGTGYVDFGTNILDTAAATIEIWARHDGVKRWSRIFDYGADDTHYFQMPWTNGTSLDKDSIGAKNGGGETQAVDTMAPYEIGTDYHIAVTFEQQGDGSTFIRWQRRDAATGELQKSGSMTMPDGLHTIVDPVLYLGHSQYTADRDALAAYDEVRLWSGVLTDSQLAESAAAGPDATIETGSEGPRFVAAAAPDTPAQRAAVSGGGFRMMTYNVQFCYDEKLTIVPDRTAARILAENPDFCCINEVRDTEAHPEAALLAKLTGMHKTFYANLLLSKEEPINVETYELPWASYSGRGLLVCEFSNVVVAVTHLDVGTVAFEARTNSIEIIRNAFAKYAEGGKPVLLGGDWNFKPESGEMAQMQEFMTILSPTNGGARTYHNHSATGGYVIDYIAVDTAHAGDIYASASYVIDDIVTSDHNPVIAEAYCRPAASGLGWVDEAFLSTGRTGTWEPSIAWDGGTWKAALGGDNVFTPGTPSGGNRVTLEVTVAFDAIPLEYDAPGNTTQGAIWLGTNGCFQVWTLGNVANVEMLPTANANPQLEIGNTGNTGNIPMWLDVEADGVTPQTGVDYTFRFTFDYTAGAYGVEVQTGLTGFTRLREKNPVNPVNPVQSFPLATTGTAVSGVRFAGDGVFTSLLGEYENVISCFRILIR